MSRGFSRVPVLEMPHGDGSRRSAQPPLYPLLIKEGSHEQPPFVSEEGARGWWGVLPSPGPGDVEQTDFAGEAPGL